MPPHGHFTWNELNTFEPDRARAFYEAALGWRFEPMPMAEGGIYLVAWQGETMVAGIFDMAQAGMPKEVPSHWFAYVEVDDVDARMNSVTQAGGTVVRPPWDIPGVGRMAVVKDTTGAVLAFLTSSPPVG